MFYVFYAQSIISICVFGVFQHKKLGGKKKKGRSLKRDCVKKKKTKENIVLCVLIKKRKSEKNQRLRHKRLTLATADINVNIGDHLIRQSSKKSCHW